MRTRDPRMTERATQFSSTRRFLFRRSTFYTRELSRETYVRSKVGLFELLKLQHRKIQSATLHRIIKPAYYEAPVSNIIERENIAARENIKNERII